MALTPPGLPGARQPDATPGTSAAWAVVIEKEKGDGTAEAVLTVGSDSYDGSVEVTLAEELIGGGCRVVVEGLTDEDYAKLPRGAQGPKLRLSLHLWWLGTVGLLGDLAAAFSGLAGPLLPRAPKPPEGSLVGVFEVTNIERQAGDRRYETVLEGEDRVQSRLARARLAGACYDGLEAALRAVGDAAKVPVEYRARGRLTRIPPTPPAGGEHQPALGDLAPGTALEGVRQLASQAQHAARAYGRPMATVRDGTLLFGDAPAPAEQARTLDADTGLVSVSRGAPRERADQAGPPGPDAPSERVTVTAVGLGRPDLKPGDVLRLTLPPEDFPVTETAGVGAALLGAATGMVSALVPGLGVDAQYSRCHLTQVVHRLSRTEGFTSTVHALVLGEHDDDGWDLADLAVGGEPTVGNRPAPGEHHPDPAQEVVQWVMHLVERFSQLTHGAPGEDVAEVREHHSPGRTPQPQDTARGHTSNVVYGQAGPDGRARAAQRLDVVREHGRANSRTEVPYLTPFALGPYGLVLPHYPGMRTVLLPRRGDPVMAGALWRHGEGPPSEPGDYWLVLPVNLPHPQQAPDDGPVTVPDGDTVHDLIDAAGHRVIETKSFVVRVPHTLTSSGHRPQVGADDEAITIERLGEDEGHKARIVLKNDGSVEISGSNITFKAQGDIELHADNVNVKVKGAMDVSGG